jgi:hypothetical protein
MRLTLIQEQTISELGKHLYDFLPGQAHPYADQSISFQEQPTPLIWENSGREAANNRQLSLF